MTFTESRSSARVLIAGYYGFGNTGDEAILAAMVRHLRARRPGLEIVVVSADPEDTAARHGVASVLWTDVTALLDAAQACDLVLLGGGGVFHDYWGARPEMMLTRRPGGIPFHSGFPFLAALAGRPSMLYAVGVGPLFTEEGRSLTRLAFELAAVATVRDEASRDLARGLGLPSEAIRVTADPAFGLLPDREAGRLLLPVPPLRPAGPLVAVCLRNWDVGVAPETWHAAVAAALDEFAAARGAGFIFVPFQSRAGEPLNDDRTAAEAVRGRMREARSASILAGSHRPDAIAGVLGHCDLVVAMRVHAVVFAALSAVPAVGLVYDPKVSRVMEQLGLGEYAHDLTTLTASGLRQALDDAWARRAQIRTDLSGKAEELKALAEQNAALALGVLDLPRPQPVTGERDRFLRRFALTKTRELEARELAIDVLEDRLTTEIQAVADRDRQIVHLTQRDRQLATILASRSWAVAQRLQRIRVAVVPPGSVRERLLRAGARIVRAFRGQGFVAGLTAVGSLLTGAVRMLARQVDEPRGLFAERYLEENNRQVVLYTDDPELFPGYQPRRGLRGRDRNPVAVSLVATARNEGENARRWFDDLTRQTRLPDEVIVVDGGSTDGTLQLLNAQAASSPFPFRVLSEPGANIAQGRNRAIAQARHPVIAATDFGCRIRPDWLERLVAPYEDDADIQVVAGWYEARVNGRVVRRRWFPSLATVRPESCVPSSRSIAFTTEAWEAAGRYPEWLTLTGEDTYFALELQRYCPSWAFVPEAVVEWQAPPTVVGYWRKLHAWTQGDGESGVRSRYYWRGFLRVAGGLVAMVAFAIGIGALLAGVNPLLGAALILTPCVPALFVLRAGMAGVFRSPVSELGVEVAVVAGFIRGARRRHVLARRPEDAVRGVVFVLSGVPIDDTGGGARATQLALELLRRRFAVVFIHKFPKYEGKELNLRIRHPHLTTSALASFDWARFASEHPHLLRDKPVAAIVEFPLSDFLPILSAVRARGGVVAYDLLDAWDTTLGADWYSPDTERRVIDESQVLVATAPTLADRLERLSGRPVTLMPNAVNARLFSRRRRHDRPRDLPPAEWTAIYVGALWGSWFDWDLLVGIARAYPEASVVVVGDYGGQCAAPPANLTFLGLKAQRDLPAYLAHADVALVPWKVDAITRATSPLKVYEYLAMGKPVVAPDLPPLADIPFVLRSADRAAFIANVGRARAMRAEGETLEAFLRQNSWAARLDDLVPLLMPPDGAGAASVS